MPSSLRPRRARALGLLRTAIVGAILLLRAGVSEAQPTPSVSLSVPTEAILGESLTFTVTFDNTSAAATGYGPYIDVILPTIGVDGAGDAADDGVTFVAASYLGVPVSAITLVFDAAGHATHPYARDAANAPLVVTGTPGNQLVVLQLPFAAFTPNQPAAPIQIATAVSALADSNVALTIGANGGFRFGADPVDNPTADPTIVGGAVSSPVTPTVLRLRKVYLGEESETATGPNYPVRYRIEADIADGQTITDLDLTDVLPGNLQFVSLDATSAGGAPATTVAISTPGTILPGGTLTRRFVSVTGTTSSADATMEFTAYVPRLAAGGGDVLDPTTGTGPPAVNDAATQGTWTPVDTRDPPGTVASDSTPSDHTLAVRPIALQKRVAVVVDNAPTGPSPTDVLEYTLDLQVSDFVALQNLVVTDVLDDGLRTPPASAPRLIVVEHGATFDQLMSTASFVTDPATGATTATFRVSDELVSGGLDGVLLGGCVPDGGTGGPPPVCAVTNQGATRLRIVYRLVIAQRYTSGAPVLGGDEIDNAVSLSADVISTATLTPTGSTITEASSESVTIRLGGLVKSIYALNGSTTIPASLVLVPGDTVTFRITGTIPASDTGDITITDYLPAPIFDEAELTTFEPIIGPAPPLPGRAKFGPDETFFTLSGAAPSMSTDAGGNSVSFALPEFTDPQNRTSVVDLLLTVTATTVPAADGLPVTNLARAVEETTGSSVLADAIVQLQLTEPAVRVKKGAVATTAPLAAFTPAAVGPVTFNAPGSSGYRGSGAITSTGLAASPVDSNVAGVDAGDLVTFAIVLENTGSSSAGAFDVRVRDTLPAGFAVPSGGAGLNLQVTNGAGTAIPFSTIGSGLFDAAGGIELTDGTTGALAAGSPSSGLNIAVITYDLEVEGSAQLNQALVNTATLFNFAGAEGGPDHTGTDRTDAATATIAQPTLTKTFVSTNQTHTTGSNVAIGEQVIWQVLVRVPEGTANTVTLVDTLPAGMAFVALDAFAASPGLTATGSSTPVVTSNGQIITFDFGTVTNANRDNAADETLSLALRTVVINGGSNDRGDALRNSASLSFAGGTVAGNSPNVTVVEPLLQVAKTVTPTTGDAGDTVTYAITLSHAPGSNATAFDVTLTDVVPLGMTFSAIGTVTGLQPDSIGFGGGSVTASWASFPVGSSTTINVVATVDSGISPGQTIQNAATAIWTSLPGIVTTPQSTFNALSTERTGSPADPGGTDNDYTASGVATFTGRTATAAKTIVSTSLASTSGNTLAVGERVQYQVQIAIPEGVASAATLTDTLEPGLAFVSFDSITASAALQTSVPGGFAAVLSNRVVSNVGGGPENDGRQVVFDAGTLTNTDADNTTVEKITLLYTAVAVNTASNVRGTTAGNTMAIASTQIGQTLPGPDVTIAEPTLQLLKSAAPTLADAGDEVAFTLTVSHTGVSNATAYDLSLTDIVPAGLTYVTDSLVHASGVAPSTLSAASGTLTVGWDVLQVGETSVIEFRARLVATPTPVAPGETISNGAALTWTSLPNDVTTPQSSFNSLSTERTGDTTDPGGSANSYAVSDNESVTVSSSSLSGFVYIDATNDGIKGAMEPGIAGVRVTLTGTDHLGAAVSSSTDTLADGAYTFTALRPGTYTLTESQPPGFVDGFDTVGTPVLAATAGNDVISGITLPARTNTAATAFNFGERATVDLSITKIDTPDPVLPGGTIVYTLRLTNAGPNPAFNALFTDPIPGGTTFVSLTAPGWTCTTPPAGSTGTVTCSNSMFAAGSVDFVLTVAVGSGVVPHSRVNNAATITSLSSDPTPANNRATSSTIVAATDDADLEIQKEDTPDPAVVGQDVTYTVTVRNNGPATTDATVTDTLPATMTLVSATSTIGTCTGTAPVSCSLPGMTAGTTATLTIVATATAEGVHTNAASVSGTAPDPNLTNNQAEAQTTVGAAGSADVGVIKRGPAVVARGGNVTYTIDVTNHGPGTAVAVTVGDAPPPVGVSFLANSGDCATAFPCALGTLNAGETRRITSTFVISGAFPGSSLLNQSTVTAATPDPNPANNASDVTSTVGSASSGDLSIVKIDSPDAAVAGTTVAYALVVTNNGPAPALDVRVVDDLPGQVTLQSVTSSSGSCSGAGPIECSLGTVASGANVTIAISVLVDPAFPAPGTIVNIATVSAASDDADPRNDVVVEPTDIVSRADVSVLKTGPATVVAGTNLVYTLAVTNGGPSVARDVTLTDTTPAGLVFVSNAGDCSTTFPCTLGTLEVGETRTVTATFAVPSAYVTPTTVINTAVVSTSTFDTVEANNTSTTSTSLVREADVSITKTGPVTATPGTSVQYQITIANAGPSDAIDVVVADPAPPGLSFQVNTGDCQTAFPCTFATLPAGQSRTFTSQFMVASGYTTPDPIVNTATVSAVTTDPQSANNTASALTAIGSRSADLVVQKHGPALAIPGSAVTYTITVFNAGPSDAAAVVLDDPTPAGLAFVGNVGDCTTSFPCAFGTLAAGETRTTQATFAVPPGYVLPDPITNVATATASTPDPNVGNNTATARTSIGADLRITKTAAPEPVAAGELLTFVITATNDGAREAVDLQIVDTLPPGVELLAATPGAGGACTDTETDGRTIVTCTWTGITPAGESHRLLLTVRVDRSTPAGTVLTNVATTSSQTNDPDLTNNTASSASTVTPPAGLRITKDGPAFTTPGSQVVYTLVVTNAGEGDASAVVVEDPTPAGLTFVSNSGACTTAFPCLLPLIPSGDSRTITSTFQVPDGYDGPNPIVNIATLPVPVSLAGEPERRAIAVTALAGADVSIVKSGGPGNGIRGTQVPFTLVVRNLGPLAAENVRVTDPTPEGYIIFDMAGACATFPCEIGTLLPGETRTISVVYLTDVDSPPTEVNTATVTTSTLDPNLANNVASAPLRGGADVMVTKIGPPVAAPGQSVEYTIVVTNLGPSDATSVLVADPTPAGMVFVANSGACTTAFPCTIDLLRVNESQTIRSTFQVLAATPAGTAIENVVAISAPIADPTPANNLATATTMIQADGPDPCASQSGLPPGFDPDADADGDGISNGDECGGGGHPLGFFERYLPEGATGGFFHARITIEHGGLLDLPAHVLIHYEPEGMPEVVQWLRLSSGGRTTIDVTDVIGIASFSTRIESDLPLNVERTMTWLPGGAHADLADDRLSTEWYFAEGATTGGFQTHYLLQNPHREPTTVDVTFLTGHGPVERTYTVPPVSRTSLWANSDPELAQTNVAVSIRSRGAPIAAARAMYRDWNGQLHVAGSSTSGASGAGADWYFAEGVTGSFFDTWLLLANFSATPSTAIVTYLLPNGETFTKPEALPARGRVSVRVNDVDERLASAAAAIHVQTTDGTPIVVERSVWWPSPNYYEGHQASGVPRPAPVWRFGEGLVDADSQTFVLVANFAPVAGSILLTLKYDDGESAMRVIEIGATSRLTLDLGVLAPESAGRRFHFEVASLGTSLPLVVERSVYSSSNGRLWGSGTSILGAPIAASTRAVAPPP